MWTNAAPSEKHLASRSIEVAPRGTEDQIHEALEVIRAVEGDANDTAILSERLDLHIRLESMPELLLDASCGRVGTRPIRRHRDRSRRVDAWRTLLLGREFPSSRLDFADRQLPRDNLVGELELSA